MLEAAEHAGVVHLVGHEFRWLPERAMVARAIAVGLIGKAGLMTFLQYIALVASLECENAALVVRYIGRRWMAGCFGLAHR